MTVRWHHRFLELAQHVAGWSKDPSTQVGAVIARPDNTIASLGFNGLPRGLDDNDWLSMGREVKLAMTVHAEENAILAAKEPLVGYTLYVWPMQPCASCAAKIIQSGISRVVTTPERPERWADSFAMAMAAFEEAGVVVNRYS